MGDVTDGLFELWDSPEFRKRYHTDAYLYNVFNTLTKALEVACELLREADVWMRDDENDGAEPLPIGTGAKIERFLANLPKPTAKRGNRR